MTIVKAWAYGTAEGVASLRPRYTNVGSFDTTTNPTLAVVEKMLNQVSSILNSMLANYGFVIPVTAEMAVDQLTLFVEMEVAEMLDSIRGGGRQGALLEKTGKLNSIYSLIHTDVQNFIKESVHGFENLGATRTNTDALLIFTKGDDDDGIEYEPLFQREDFEPFERFE